jgi:hypothetical protein
MSNPSNLYAEKVFAEHPTGLWALDDKADYISLISEAQRNLSNWSISGGTYEEYAQSVDEPDIMVEPTSTVQQQREFLEE